MRTTPARLTVVDLISDIVDLLSRRQRRLGEMVNPETLVFPGENGSIFLTGSTLLRRELYPAMRRAGVPRRGPGRRDRPRTQE